jgi:hypothetical protein
MPKSPPPWRKPALSSLLLVLVAGVLSSAPSAQAAPRAPHHQRQQHVTLRMLPPLSQAGPTPRSSRKASGVIEVAVSPARPGHLVTLQRHTSHGWRGVAHARQNGRGVVHFVVPPARSGRHPAYRATAAPYGALPAARSRAKVDPWTKVVFDEEFTGNKLDDAWDHRIQFYNPWGGRRCSKGSPLAVAVGGGALELSSLPDSRMPATCPVRDPVSHTVGRYPYRLNGHISTQHSFDFQYGVAAARMRFQRDPGAHAAFWLQPRGLLDAKPTPWGAEVDVVEFYGAVGSRSRMVSAVHEPTPSGKKIQIGGAVPSPNRFLASRSDSWWRNYHVFSVQWTAREYIFRISGHEVWRTDRGVSHHPEFLILSMLSSDFELPSLAADGLQEQSASVDWVKVWQRGSVGQ